MSDRGRSAWSELKERCDQDYAMQHILQAAPVPLGIPTLDDRLGGGIPTGTFTVVAGEGGTGKSAMACIAMYEAAYRGRCPVYFSLEMPQHMVISRLLSIHARRRGLKPVWWSTTRKVVETIAHTELKTQRDAVWYMSNHADRDPVLVAWKDFEKTIWPRMAVVDDAPGIEWICNCVRALVTDGVKPMPIVDYVQLGAGNDGSEYECVTRASHMLQVCAKECAVPMLAISSLRNIKREERKESPTISMLRGSGHLGYDAGTVIVLRREGERVGSEQPITAHIVKNRVGDSNINVPLTFNGGANQFT